MSSHIKVLKWLRLIAIVYAQLLAFLPFSMDTQTFKIKRRRFYWATPILSISLMLLSMFNQFQIRQRLFFYTDVTNAVMFILAVLYNVTFVITTIHHYVQLDTIEEIFVQGHKLYARVIELKKQPECQYGRLLVLFSVNGFGLHIAYSLFLVARFQVMQVSFQYDNIGHATVLLTSAVHSIVPSLFYAAMIWCLYLIREVNMTLRRIVAGSLRVDQRLDEIKQCQSQHIFCELSDQLDAVAVCHLELCQFIHKLEKVANIPLTMWISYRSVCALVEVFSMYMYMSGWLTRPQLGSPIHLVWTAFFGAVLNAIFLAMVANVCLVTREEVRGKPKKTTRPQIVYYYFHKFIVNSVFFV